MRQIYKGIALCATLATTASGAFAQTDEALDAFADTLDNKVQVAFRSVDKQDLLNGVSAIDMKEMAAKNYSSYSLDYIENVVGGVNNGLWGYGDYLVVVDGMVRDANNVLPTEIDQITLLKGSAAVVLYGPRAAKGVLQITTKRGQMGDLRINVHANGGMNTKKAFKKYKGTAEYMSL